MTSSSWVSGDQPKKRVPTIRKTMKKTSPTIETDNYDSTETMYNDMVIDDEVQNTRNTKVNELLEKMSSLKTNDDGDYLENFTPLSYPEQDQEVKVENSILPSDYSMKRRHVTNTNFTADRPSNIHSDFNRIYDVTTSKPFYTSGTGLGKESKNDKITDRLGYIVHLLEQQQNEKTDNVLEECVLYVLLGTFVIFVVDSFSRGGKYIR
jgi:hypothetical protein